MANETSLADDEIAARGIAPDAFDVTLWDHPSCARTAQATALLSARRAIAALRRAGFQVERVPDVQS